MGRKSASPNAIFFRLFELEARKGDQRKFEIVDALISCIAKEGIRDTTYDTVAEELGITRQHILYHFKDFDELLSAAMRYIVACAHDSTLKRLQLATGWKTQVGAFVVGPFDWAENYPGQLSVMLAFFHFCGMQSRYRELNDQVRETGRARIQAILVSNRKDLGLSKSRPETLATEIQLLISGALVYAGSTSRRQSFPELSQRTLESAFRLISASNVKLTPKT